MNKLSLLILTAMTCGSLFACTTRKAPQVMQTTNADGAITQKAGDASGNKERVIATKEDTAKTEKRAIPTGAMALLRAYPNNIVDYNDGSLVFKDGSRIVYDDGKEKSFTARLDAADPEDMFFCEYNTEEWTPKRLSDAGRVRCEKLFRKLYGNSREEVGRRLTTVNWFGQKIRFTSSCGAADSLKAVARELAKMPELRKYLTGASTFYWRQVRGANRLSAHSYGIAIDINTTYSDYWLWKYPKRSETAEIGYINRIPKAIVRVFERHGFIWGGRWYHFDTMHFEFRPELRMNIKN